MECIIDIGSFWKPGVIGMENCEFSGWGSSAGIVGAGIA
jgi:hypothetical protein